MRNIIDHKISESKTKYEADIPRLLAMPANEGERLGVWNIWWTGFKTTTTDLFLVGQWVAQNAEKPERCFFMSSPNPSGGVYDPDIPVAVPPHLAIRTITMMTPKEEREELRLEALKVFLLLLENEETDA